MIDINIDELIRKLEILKSSTDVSGYYDIVFLIPFPYCF